MPASIETMFYAGEPVWHSLGTRVNEAVTSGQALTLSGLNWEVKPEPIQVVGGSIVNGFKANVRSTDQKVLGIVTDRYKVVQNQEAFAFTDFLLGEGVKYETAGSLSSGKRVWMLAKLEPQHILGDEVIPYLVFTNSHDGTGAVKVAVTPIRVVCQNTLTMALSNANRVWSVRHCGNISGKIEEARETLNLASTYMENLKEMSEELSQIVIVEPQFADFLTAMFPITDGLSDRQKANMESYRTTLRNIYNNKDDLQRFKGTAIGVINAVADFEAHVAPARMTNTYQENNFMTIVDGGKKSLMFKASEYFDLA